MDAREYRQLINKQRNLPGQYRRALLHVEHIELELHRYGLPELILEARKPTSGQYLTEPAHLDFPSEVEIARICAALWDGNPEGEDPQGLRAEHDSPVPTEGREAP